ncbi:MULTISPECIES: hypothetical protein [Clostridium]|nr:MULTISPECIES: hypothetical protein [Clostridium]MBN7577268.1 hypothetical protein [Clostridium beijerinckii]MBN7579817.1 hypothetical protein [Clostridium beijerinckii]MBN7587039.1 hypothetical protein [Clostridium beijerinckii]MZK50993.1 hypothetical protein [Clostridium beijerinckii]MZK59195.1 hypothetical protein [Clostridium beijerinckii]
MLEACSCMTCPFLGGGCGTQGTIKKINLSFKKCVYRYTHNSYNTRI